MDMRNIIIGNGLCKDANGVTTNCLYMQQPGPPTTEWTFAFNSQIDFASALAPSNFQVVSPSKGTVTATAFDFGANDPHDPFTQAVLVFPVDVGDATSGIFTSSNPNINSNANVQVPP